LVDVRADVTGVHERPSVLHDTACPVTFSFAADAFHFTVSF
jgi:hypothetical protein